MKYSKIDLVKYRLNKARDTFDDAVILASNEKWNSVLNRLYYSAYYAVSALLLDKDINSKTHNGTKSAFSEQFIKTGIIPKEYGKIYSQLFTWRQKGDYDDFFQLEKDKILTYFEPVNKLIELIDNTIFLK